MNAGASGGDGMHKPERTRVSSGTALSATQTKEVSNAAALAWGIGGCADNVGVNTLSVLLMPIYSIALGVSPALIGLAMGLSRIWDAFTDPVMGNISDNTRTRWGRRRPYIAIGSTLMSALFILLWVPPMSLKGILPFLYFQVITLAFFTGYTVWCVPYAALGFELTTDYHGRTKVQAYRTFFAMIGNFLLPWAYKLCFVFGGPRTDSVPSELRGVRIVGLLYGLVILAASLSPALFCRERLEVQEQEKIRFIRAFQYTVKNRCFLYVALTLLLAVAAVLLPLPFGQYVNIYYVFSGDKEAASLLTAVGGTLNTVVCVLATPLVGWFGTRFGKRRTLLAGLVVSCVGSLSFWFSLTPKLPYLQLVSLAIYSPALLCAWILAPSMLADICDLDELNTGLRREGMYGAMNAWVVKSGTALALTLSGVLIRWTGIDPELAGAQTPEAILRMRVLYPMVPALCVALAFMVVFLCPLTESRSREVRAILDARHACRPPTGIHTDHGSHEVHGADI